MRFQIQTGRDADEWTKIEDPAARLVGFLEKDDIVLRRARHMVDWRWHADVMLDFRELRRPAVIYRLACWLGVNASNPDGVIERATSQETLTRSQADETSYWSDEAERIFVERGGPALNEAFGYEDAKAAASIARAS
ncbi:MAG: hypothetical protein AAFV77_12680 [Planctomycetota bacterium]